MRGGVAELIDDARAAWAHLSGLGGVDRRRMVLIGQSLGSTIALMLMAGGLDPGPSAVVLLAPPGRPLPSLIVDQTAREARRLGLGTEEVRRRRELTRRALEGIGMAATGELRGLSLVVLHDLAEVDPAALARSVDCPVLAVHGGADIQVSTRADVIRLYDQAVKRAAPWQLALFSDLDHLLKGPGALPPPASYFSERPVSEKALERIAGWIEAQHRSGR
jgi:fermentation-respiration switch protein FrsA (DUF1100 family)